MLFFSYANPMRFRGNIYELKDALLLGGVDGFWEDAENRFVLKSYNGAVINFYPTTG